MGFYGLMPNHFPNSIITALTEALKNVFWTKKHLRQILGSCEVPPPLIAAQDWDDYKYHIIGPIVTSLNNSDDGLGPLSQLVRECLAFKNADHLLKFQDGKQRKADAEEAVARLGELVAAHDENIESKKEDQRRRQAELARDRERLGFQQQLEGLKAQFMAFHSSSDPHRRGYDLEKLLYALFVLFELDPVGPFKVIGEQIDGAFILDSDNFLLEAKWQAKGVQLKDLRDLDGSVGSKLDNTLGLFLSINGFTEDALSGYAKGSRPRLICMDGLDLMAVLEGQIDLGILLRRKRTCAAQKSDVFVSARDILAGNV
jgi:hypothetical protein